MEDVKHSQLLVVIDFQLLLAPGGRVRDVELHIKNRTKAIRIRNQTAANPSTARAYSHAETDGGAGEERASSHLHGRERRAPLAPSGELQPGGVAAAAAAAAARGARALGERTARRDGVGFYIRGAA